MTQFSRPPEQNFAASELSAALAACRRAFLAVALFSGMSNVLMLTGALFMLEIYDRVLPSRSVPTLVALLILAGGLYAAQGFIDAIRSRILVRVGHSLDEAMSTASMRSSSGCLSNSAARAAAPSQSVIWIQCEVFSPVSDLLPCSICHGCRFISPSASRSTPISA